MGGGGGRGNFVVVVFISLLCNVTKLFSTECG